MDCDAITSAGGNYRVKVLLKPPEEPIGSSGGFFYLKFLACKGVRSTADFEVEVSARRLTCVT